MSPSEFHQYPDWESFRQETGAEYTTLAELWPYLRSQPQAPICVKIDNWLVPITGIHYDNEFGLLVLEVDLGVDSKPREVMLREKLRKAESHPYFCPTSGQMEDPRSGGFDVCCDRPDLHRSSEPGQ